MKIDYLTIKSRFKNLDQIMINFDENQLMTIAAFLIALGVLVFFVNTVWSIRKGEVATGNVWNSRSPEWQVPSPMPMHNYEKPFIVVGEPYDYGLPDSIYVKFMESE